MQDALDLIAVLTTRELEVLVALWQNRGCSARELAGILFVSEACVRFHLHNIYQRLKVKGKLELLLLCRDIDFGPVATRLSQSQNRRPTNG